MPEPATRTMKPKPMAMATAVPASASPRRWRVPATIAAVRTRTLIVAAAVVSILFAANTARLATGIDTHSGVDRGGMGVVAGGMGKARSAGATAPMNSLSLGLNLSLATDESALKSPHTRREGGASAAASSSRVSFETNFTFPSIEERVAYYMGDWRNRTLRPGDIPCGEIPTLNRVVTRRPVLWEAGRLEREVRTNRGWLVGSYLRDAHDVVDRAAGGRAGRWILWIGDHHPLDGSVPAVSKTRFSRFATESGTGRPPFATIVWPFEMSRHYDPVAEYVKLREGGGVREWEEKKPTLIWRGGANAIELGYSDKRFLTTYVEGGARIRVVREYFGANTSDVDVAFPKDHGTLKVVPAKFEKEKRLVRGSHLGMSDQLNFKYILSLEGNDVATGLKWQLASNSVVFMARPTTVSFLMEDLLVPFVHYIPVKDDYSNLIEMVHWARRNDEKCKWIAEQSTLYMQRMWTSDRARKENADVKRGLGEVYQQQFGDAVESCAA